jgi:REP element-mobilizing transposase RayT
VTYARKSLLSLEDTPYYHVVARCVRRAWLWGFDEYAGKDYSHRKEWVLERLQVLTQIFAIEICAYAIMSNHYHLVVYVDAARARHWSDVEVMGRWRKLFRLPELVQRYRDRECITAAEHEQAKELIAKWRARLHDVSWFMRALNEYLARRANAEDECKGRFWEGRFKSQALLDEAGLLTAMAYVDLNPVRAGIAGTPEESEFTSIYARIQRYGRRRVESLLRTPRLRNFRDEGSAGVLPFKFKAYLELVDWSSRGIRPDKRGHIDDRLPSILTRLSIDVDAWQEAMRPGKHCFGRALGRLDRLRLHARRLRQAWIRGQRNCGRLYGCKKLRAGA